MSGWGTTNASIKWSIDKLIKEISKPEYGVEIKLSTEMPRDNELHFIMTVRDIDRDKTILRDLARVFYNQKK